MDGWAPLDLLQPTHAVDLNCLASGGDYLYSAGGDPFGAAGRGFVKRWQVGGGVPISAVPSDTLLASDAYFTGKAARARARARCPTCVGTSTPVSDCVPPPHDRTGEMAPTAAIAVRAADMCVVAGDKDGMGVVLDGLGVVGAPHRDVRFDKAATVSALVLAGTDQGCLVSAANKTVRLWDLSPYHAPTI